MHAGRPHLLKSSLIWGGPMKLSCRRPRRGLRVFTPNLIRIMPAKEIRRLCVPLVGPHLGLGLVTLSRQGIRIQGA